MLNRLALGCCLMKSIRLLARVHPRAVRDGAWISRDGIGALSPWSSVSVHSCRPRYRHRCRCRGSCIPSLPPRDSSTSAAMLARPLPLEGWRAAPLQGSGVAQRSRQWQTVRGYPGRAACQPGGWRHHRHCRDRWRVVPTALEDQDGFVARGGTGGGEKVPGIVQLVP